MVAFAFDNVDMTNTPYVDGFGYLAAETKTGSKTVQLFWNGQGGFTRREIDGADNRSHNEADAMQHAPRSRMGKPLVV